MEIETKYLENNRKCLPITVPKWNKMEKDKKIVWILLKMHALLKE